MLLKSDKDGAVLLAKLCAQILDENKMEDVRVINVGETLQIAEYFVVASGRTQRHVKAASDELVRKLRELGTLRRGLEGYRDGKWLLLDFTDVIIHIFSSESRPFYDLENLWGDCPRVNWSDAARGEAEQRQAVGPG